MSYVFDSYEGSDIWTPGLRTGELFVAMADELSRSLDISTGLEVLANDWHRIHAAPFADFVHAVEARTRNNRIFSELVRGFLSVSIILLERLDDVAEAEALAALLDLGEPGLDTLRAGMSHI